MEEQRSYLTSIHNEWQVEPGLEGRSLWSGAHIIDPYITCWISLLSGFQYITVSWRYLYLFHPLSLSLSRAYLFYPSSECSCAPWCSPPCSSLLHSLSLKALTHTQVFTCHLYANDLQSTTCKCSSSHILTTYWRSPLECPIGTSTSACPFILPPKSTPLPVLAVLEKLYHTVSTKSCQFCLQNIFRICPLSLSVLAPFTPFFPCIITSILVVPALCPPIYSPKNFHMDFLIHILAHHLPT